MALKKFVSINMLKLYNTLTKTKESFTPLEGTGVRMYNCGPTVYNYVHIGNLRAYIFADVLRRTLEYFGYGVKQIINITDFGHLSSDADTGEDKMLKGLKREGLPLKKESMQQIADTYTKAFEHDLTLLNIKHPHALPRASKHIGEQIALIQKLEENGFTYTTRDGVYFDTSKSPHYGKLGGLSEIDTNTTGNLSAALSTAQAYKKSPRDFALWKFSDTGIGWESPWGTGSPGWHIECSAMSMSYLGESFDIHTGGTDHIAIHHNNEIAQSESATGKPLANFWMHSAFVTFKDEKMAKSRGTGITLQDLIERGIHPLSYRYFVLGAHYRSPIEFSWEALDGAQNTLERIVRKVHELQIFEDDTSSKPIEYKTKFKEIIGNDLDTPVALGLLHDVLHSNGSSQEILQAIFDFDRVLGLNIKELSHQLTDIPKEHIKLQEKSNKLRNKGKYENADKVRDELVELGYEVKDSSDKRLIHKTLATLARQLS